MDATAVPAPPLSVVVATRMGWPGCVGAVRSIRRELEPLGGELVVVDGSGRPVPPADELGSTVRWVERPGASVFVLARDGYPETSAPIVAITEDHCEVRPGWAAGILAAHAAWPGAAAVGGAIENGSTATVMDRASYWITQGPFQAPLRNGPTDRVATEANLSFKRNVLLAIPDVGGMGSIVLLHLLALRDRGAVLVNDDAIVVDHFQAVGFGETSAIHFHNGRTIAAFRRHTGGATEVLRWAALPLLAPYRALRVMRIGWSKGRDRRWLLASAPAILWLEWCHAAGELLGYVAGPGRSAEVLR